MQVLRRPSWFVRLLPARTDFWRESSVSPLDQGYHWNQNGETLYLIGEAMGEGWECSLASEVFDYCDSKRSGHWRPVTLLHFLDPDIPEADVLSVLLEFEGFVGRAVFDSAIRVLHRDIVVNLDTIPPEGEACRFGHLVALPVGGLEDEVEGMPLAVRAPGIDLRDMLHADCPDPVWPDFPGVGISNVFSLGGFDLQFVTVLHVNAAVGVALGLIVTTGTHHDEFHVPFEIVILLFGNKIMGSPFFSAIRHEDLPLVGRTLHHFPGDGHVFLGPHRPVLRDRLHRSVKRGICSLGSVHSQVLGFVISCLFLGFFRIGRHSDQGASSAKNHELFCLGSCHGRLSYVSKFGDLSSETFSSFVLIKSRLDAGLLPASFRPMIPVAVFDSKSYDREYLSKASEGLDLSFFTERLSARTASLARDCRAVCLFVNDVADRESLVALKERGITMLALRCAGFNNVDLETARELGMIVTRVPAYSPHAVAEHTLALLLALNRQIHRAYHRVRDHNFSLAGLVGFDLYGKNVGIIGCGKIGRITAEIFRGFGCQVSAYDPSLDGEWAAAHEVRPSSLDDLLETSDIVSLHLPLTPQTHHLINEDALARMKKRSTLINTGRGKLIETKALIQSLKSGHLRGVALDVYEEEEGVFFEDLSGEILHDDDLTRLLTFPNVLVTSHQAFLTEEALTEIAQTTCENLRRVGGGESPLEGTRL